MLLPSFARILAHGVAVVTAVLLAAAPARALTIQFDYTYDDGGFFSGANLSRRNLLESAATVFTSRITDNLTAIQPGGSNTWFAQPADPRNVSVTLSIPNLVVPANTVIVYVGAYNIGGNTLGVGGPGGYTANGFQSFFDTLKGRGQAGALLAAGSETDFGPWGGMLTFNNAMSWYFDNDPSTLESFAGQSDFYSVAVHEIAHLMGMGTAASFQNKVSGTTFTGANSVAAFGGNPSVTADKGHWVEGTTSLLPGVLTSQEAAMDPTIVLGTRKYFTTLDYAGLADIGWQVSAIPEPSSVAALAGLGALTGAVAARRRRAGS